jgi:hypothetical protein
MTFLAHWVYASETVWMQRIATLALIVLMVVTTATLWVTLEDVRADTERIEGLLDRNARLTALVDDTTNQVICVMLIPSSERTPDRAAVECGVMLP